MSDYQITVKGTTYNITEETNTLWVKQLFMRQFEFKSRPFYDERMRLKWAKKEFLDRLEFWIKAPTLTDLQLITCLYAYDQVLTKGLIGGKYKILKEGEFKDYIYYICRILIIRAIRNGDIHIPEKYRPTVEAQLEAYRHSYQWLGRR
jgi:hypothetical protein